jgi:hypothetical protein
MTNKLHFGDNLHVLAKHIGDEEEARWEKRFRKLTKATPEKPA